MGLRPVGRPAWMRGRYVVAAIDRYGREVNVVLDARDGQVLAVRPLGRGGFGPPPPRLWTPGGHTIRWTARAASGPGPGGPPVDDDEFFDNDQQQGSLPPRAPARIAIAATRAVGDRQRRPEVLRPLAGMRAPTPRPRPSLAKVNDPGAASAKPADAPRRCSRSSRKAARSCEGCREASRRQGCCEQAKDAAKPDATKPDAAKPGAPKPDAGQARRQRPCSPSGCQA